MGPKDWNCVIVGRQQSQKIYADFSSLHPDHEHLSLEELKKVVLTAREIQDMEESRATQLMNEKTKIFDKKYKCDTQGSLDCPPEPGFAVVTIREFPIFIPWEVKRLLYLGLNDKGSVLSWLPKDILMIVMSSMHSKSFVSKELKLIEERRISAMYWQNFTPKDQKIFVKVCGSSADEWCFYLPELQNDDCPMYPDEPRLYYGNKMPFELGCTGFENEMDDKDIEEQLKISINDEYHQYWVAAIHTHAFSHLLLNCGGASPEMLIDICENDLISETLRNSWIKMNYANALASMRKHFGKTIGKCFAPEELQTIRNDFCKRIGTVVSYATVAPRLQSEQPTKKKKF